MKRIDVSYLRRTIGLLLTALLLFLGSFAPATIDAQEQFAKYKWRSGKVEDLTKSVQGFKWGMSQAEIQKIMGRTDDLERDPHGLLGSSGVQR